VRVVERAVSGHREQPGDFVGGEGAPLSARVESAVGHRNAGEVVVPNPLRLREPVRERHDALPIVVPGRRAHVPGDRFGEPRLDLVAAQVAERFESEFVAQTADGAVGVRPVHVANFRDDERLQISADVRLDGTEYGAGGVEFASVEDADADRLAFLLPRGEFLPDVRLVSSRQPVERSTVRPVWSLKRP
jgi:hypothetical protein